MRWAFHLSASSIQQLTSTLSCSTFRKTFLPRPPVLFVKEAGGPKCNCICKRVEKLAWEKNNLFAAHKLWSALALTGFPGIERNSRQLARENSAKSPTWMSVLPAIRFAIEFGVFKLSTWAQKSETFPDPEPPDLLIWIVQRSIYTAIAESGGPHPVFDSNSCNAAAIASATFSFLDKLVGSRELKRKVRKTTAKFSNFGKVFRIEKAKPPIGGEVLFLS